MTNNGVFALMLLVSTICLMTLSGCGQRFYEAQRDPVGAFHRYGIAAQVRNSYPRRYTDCKQSCYADTCTTVCETW